MSPYLDALAAPVVDTPSDARVQWETDEDGAVCLTVWGPDGETLLATLRFGPGPAGDLRDLLACLSGESARAAEYMADVAVARGER